MSQFVNYNKRSIQLPSGCKDLADLFKPAGLLHLPNSSAPHQDPVVLRDDSFTATLGSIEKCAATFFDSRASGFYLTISSPDEKLSLSVFRMTEDIMSKVTFLHDEAREKAMILFLDRHGFEAPRAHEMPNYFWISLPDLPVWTIFALSPIPSAAPAFSKIACELFRDFCGMNDQSELRFSLVEYQKAK
jgi:hypothetical protein